MLNIKNIKTKRLISLSRKVTSVCTEDVDRADNAHQIFWLENNKCLLFSTGWSVWLLFLFFVLAPNRRCCLCNEVTPTEEASPLSTGFYNLQLAI
jgi:hypothetical protein